MSTVNDYIGRTIDVVAFQGTKASGEILLEQTLAEEGTGGRINTGIVKLGQRFLIEILTERGSLKHRPERGTSFMIEVRQQRIRTATELQAAFARGLVDARRNLINEETATDPDDERFGGARIVSVELRAGNAKIFVDLRSRDSAARAILPIEVSLI